MTTNCGKSAFPWCAPLHLVMLRNATWSLVKGNILCNNIKLLSWNQGYFFFQLKQMKWERKRDRTSEWKKWVVKKSGIESPKDMEKVDVQRWPYHQEGRGQVLGLTSVPGSPSHGAMRWKSWSCFSFTDRLSLCRPATTDSCGLCSASFCFELLPHPWPTRRIKLCT